MCMYINVYTARRAIYNAQIAMILHVVLCLYNAAFTFISAVALQYVRTLRYVVSRTVQYSTVVCVCVCAHHDYYDYL